MEIETIAQKYVQKYNAYKEARDKIESRIDQRKDQIGRLEKKRDRLVLPSWIDELLTPIAKALLATMPDRYYDILGPFGMCAETSIHFYKKGIPDGQQLDGDNCKSISFRPDNLEEGELSLVDHNTDTGRFNKGTMGEVNGMNYPSIPTPKTTEELLKFVA